VCFNWGAVVAGVEGARRGAEGSLWDGVIQQSQHDHADGTGVAAVLRGGTGCGASPTRLWPRTAIAKARLLSKVRLAA
jgi:hypothetical protein